MLWNAFWDTHDQGELSIECRLNGLAYEKVSWKNASGAIAGTIRLSLASSAPLIVLPASGKSCVCNAHSV